MKLLVHIGPTKTGSTSLQRFLATHTGPLTARGLRYERWDRTTRLDSSQIEVPVAALAQQDQLIPFDQTRKMFGLGTLEKTKALAKDWLSWLDQKRGDWPEDTLLLSSEHLIPWLRDKVQVQHLDRLLSDRFDEVRYVTYLRPQEEWLLSQYAQSLRAGSTRTLREEIEQRLSRVQFDMPDYSARLRPWINALGKDRLVVKRLKADMLTGGDLTHDFTALAGVDTTDLPRPAQQNTSFGSLTAETLRQINLRFPLFGKGSSGPNAARLQLVRVLAAKIPDTHDRPLQLSKDLRAHVDRTYRPGNDWLAAQYPDSCSDFAALSSRERHPVQKVSEADVITNLTKIIYAYQVQNTKPLAPASAKNANGPRNYKAPEQEAWL